MAVAVLALFPFVPRRRGTAAPPSGACDDHVAVWRWVQRYGPEMEQRLRRRLKPTNDSWQVDETYIRVKGEWAYLYRTVDSTGATIDFLLSAKRDVDALSASSPKRWAEGIIRHRG